MKYLVTGLVHGILVKSEFPSFKRAKRFAFECSTKGWREVTVYSAHDNKLVFMLKFD